MPPRPTTLVVGLAILAVALLGLREIRSEDLGYHLAYGARFLDGHGVVDHDERIYTNPAPAPADAQASGAAAPRPAAGPGCWYDETGRYRFANANWGSQVLMAIAWRAGGDAGLAVLLAGLLALLAALLLRLFARSGSPLPLAAVATMALTMLAAPRLTLRPELFGDVVLLLQANILVGRRRLRDVDLGALALAQLLFVNLHGYFVLGLALIGATLVGRAVTRGVRAASVRRLAIALGGATAVSFVNPWGWRLAVLPIETVRFMRTHEIAAGVGTHPWSVMGEMHRALPLPPGWTGDPIAITFAVLLTICAAGALAALRTRRWSSVLIIVGMSLVASASWRNMAIGMMVAVPCALGALCRLLLPRTKDGPLPAFSAAGALACALFTACFLTGTLHRVDSRYPVPAPGRSAAHLPLGAVEWLRTHDVPGRLWAAPTCTSTIYGFADDAPELNLVTNTWAYPPDVMRAVLRAGGTWGPEDFEPVAQRFGIGAVITPPGAFLRGLVASGRWTPVHLDAGFVVLLRAEHATDALATVDVGGTGPFGAHVDRYSAAALADLGRVNDAIVLLMDRTSGSDRHDPRTWAVLAELHRRAVGTDDDPAYHVKLARLALLRAIELDADPRLRENLAALDRFADARAMAE